MIPSFALPVFKHFRTGAEASLSVIVHDYRDKSNQKDNLLGICLYSSETGYNLYASYNVVPCMMVHKLSAHGECTYIQEQAEALA